MVRLLGIAATMVAFCLASMGAAVAHAATSTIGSTESTAGPTVAQVNDSTTWSAGNSCYYPNCTAAHKAGEGDIPSSSPHYCSKQDRDGDGIACEW
jgi:hypothetical protein